MAQDTIGGAKGIATTLDVNEIAEMYTITDEELYQYHAYLCPTKASLKKIFSIPNAYSSDECLVAYNDLSRKDITITIKIVNTLDVGFTLEQIIIYSGGKEVASKTSGFSKIDAGSSSQYSFTISKDSSIDGKFGIKIGRFGTKRQLVFTDKKYTGTGEVLGTDNYVERHIGSYPFVDFLIKNYNETPTAIVYVKKSS